tara:strand:- start:365 stop:751 length:387 start_codon:yes stop_codon:yes gene_type:complete
MGNLKEAKSSLELLEKEHPSIVEKFKKLNTTEELLEACCSESLDALAMEERLIVFMEDCIPGGPSYTTYKPEVYKEAIQEAQENRLNEWCFGLTGYEDFIEGNMTKEEFEESAIKEVTKRAKKYYEEN